MSEETRMMHRGGSDLGALAEAARHGDETALDRLYATARPQLLRWALALGAGDDVAPDLTQDTLWAVHRNLARFDPARGSFESWAATILIRRLRNHQRARTRRFRLVSAFRRTASEAVEPCAAAVEARATLARLLGALTEREREVVALYEIAELDAKECGRVLGVTPAGVRSIARDARRKLARAAHQGVPREDSR